MEVIKIKYLKNTLYKISTAFFLRYGFVDVNNDIMSFDKSRARSGDIKHAREDNATPASYMFCEFRSLRIILVVSINTFSKIELKYIKCLPDIFESYKVFQSQVTIPLYLGENFDMQRGNRCVFQ